VISHFHKLILSIVVQERVKASKILGEAARARAVIPLSLCYPLHCWWCWRALPLAIITFVKSLNCANLHPIRIGDERERLVTASPVMRKSRAPAGENIYPENGLVKPPRRDTRAFSPAGMSGERRRLAKWRRRADCTRHQCPCAVRLFTFFANGEYKLD